MNLNKVILVGRVGRDPELKALPSGSQVVSFSLATSRNWRDKEGEKHEETEWHNIIFWGKQAEIIGQYVKKGSLLLVEGRLQTRSWEAEGVKKYRTEIMGENFQLPPKNMNGGGDDRSDADRKFDEIDRPPKKTVAKKSSKKVDVEYPEDEINPDDIPF